MTKRPVDAVPTRTDIRRALVVVAAGSGTRLGYGMPKAVVELSDRIVLDHALDAVAPELALDLVVLVLPEDPEAHQRLTAAGSAVAQRCGCDVLVVPGGRVRTDSVRAGVQVIQEHAQLKQWVETVHVLVHDAARALTPTEVFSRVLETLEAGSAAVIPALPVTDTIKRAVSTGHFNNAPMAETTEAVAETLPRAQLRAVQTPQGFTLDLLERAFAHIADMTHEDAAHLTDEAMIAEELGERVDLVSGHPHALKITTPTDLITARGILKAQREKAQMEEKSDPERLPRVGIGQDIHAFAPAEEPRELWLAGLHWPGEQGLAGHSDADPVAHAACAALFSAAGLGDLGTHFGADTIGTAQPQYKGASGADLLREAVSIVRHAGFQIGSISVQVIANRPKFAPRREEAQRVLSEAAGVPVAVSATTSDGLGFTGRGEGIMATATAVIC